MITAAFLKGIMFQILESTENHPKYLKEAPLKNDQFL